VAETVCCINIFHLTWPTSPSYLAKPRCSQLLHNVENWNVLFATKYLTTELAHSKLKYGSFSSVFVVMTDGLKIVRIHARNVPCVHGQKRLDDVAFLASLSFQESDGIAFWYAEVPSCWNKKIVSGQPAHVWQWPLSKKVVATVCPLQFDIKSEQSECNKYSVR